MQQLKYLLHSYNIS